MNSSTNSAFDSSHLTSTPASANSRGTRASLYDTQTSGSIYDSALENLSALSHLQESPNNNSSTTDIEESLFTDFANIGATHSDLRSSLNASMRLLQSESTNTSQEEVDPKSQLANKTIFKTDNPNLSIIEINQNSMKDCDAANSVLLIESSDDDEATPVGQENHSLGNTAAEKRRQKAQTLLHSSKQKLDVAIAEASATESRADAAASTAENSHHNETGRNNHTQDVQQLEGKKREITVYETFEEFERNLPPTVTVLDTPFGSKVYLVGTAHFSEESQDDVSFVIRNVRPDVVMVELCPSRVHILKLDEKTLLEETKHFNLAKIRNIIQAHGYINGIFFIMLLQMSAQIAKDLGMAPGGEFRRAFEEIRKLDQCILHLGDRPIRITLHRALRALSLWQTFKLVWRLTSCDTISIEEVEECKQRDLLEKLMQEMAGEFPAFSDVFVKERDLFLCHSLQMAALPQSMANGIVRPVRVVGVVGIGHANGIAKLWGKVDPQQIPPIMDIPPASMGTRVCMFTLKYGLLSLTLYGAFKLIRPRMSRFF